MKVLLDFFQKIAGVERAEPFPRRRVPVLPKLSTAALLVAKGAQHTKMIINRNSRYRYSPSVSKAKTSGGGIRPALRSGPGRGSDSPPGCHSVPLPFESHSGYSLPNERGTTSEHGTSLWRRWWDSNPRAILLTKRFRVVLVTTTSIHLHISRSV